VLSGVDAPFAAAAVLNRHVRTALSGLGADQDAGAPLTCGEIHRAVEGFDRVVGSGIAPAVMSRINRPLDVFFPYAAGVEYLRTPQFVALMQGAGRMRHLLYGQASRRQAAGIRSARVVANNDPGLSAEALSGLATDVRDLPTPMVYNRGTVPERPPTPLLEELVHRMQGVDLSILHCARLMWVNKGGFPPSEWRALNKNNDWVLRSLARASVDRPDARLLLLMVEYGPDVEDARRLVSELGLTEKVVWLPKLPRRELMWLMNRVSVCCGEFLAVDRLPPGGTGWEAMACGTPLLQSLRFAEGEYEAIFGAPTPPILDVRGPDDITRHLLTALDAPGTVRDLGRRSRDWFELHNGIGLARRWVDLLRLDGPHERGA
jgi:hypothetical protein